MLKTLKATLVGARPLLLHNGQLANPLNKWARALKEVNARRKKTDEDREEARELELRGGFYLDTEGRVAIPEDMVLAVVIEGARKTKNGKKVEAGVLGASAFFPLQYEGPQLVDDLVEDARFCDYRGVAIGGSTVMRARPRFEAWKLPIELMYDPSVIDERDILAALDTAGHLVGLGDFRPRFGRFSVESGK